MLTVADLPAGALQQLLRRFGIRTVEVPAGQDIPGSYWGAPEAGLRAGQEGAQVFVRADTPIHSALHEAGHAICMDSERRRNLDTDAGGEDLEECAVCYLQLMMAEALPGAGLARIAADMDAWGYSFRLGSTLAWFRGDAADARRWLLERGLIEKAVGGQGGDQLAYRLRGFQGRWPPEQHGGAELRRSDTHQGIESPEAVQGESL